ncbi:hypothetical protein RYX36_014721 [Vicia faba]
MTVVDWILDGRVCSQRLFKESKDEESFMAVSLTVVNDLQGAEIYVMQKRQKEKMKKMEEERGRIGEVMRGDDQNRKESSINIGKNKVHPGVAPNSA